MIFRTNNTEFLRLDAGEDQTKASKHIRFNDDVQARFGTGTDATIRYTGSDWFLQCNLGDAYFQNLESGKDIILKANTGSGAEEFLRLDSSADLTTASKALRFNDGVYLYMGSDNDFDVRHNGTDFQARCSTGDMNFIQADSDQDIVFQADNGSGSPTPYITLDGSAASGGDLYTVFPDRSHASFGTGRDLDLHHDSGNSYIANSTGHLYLRNSADDKDIIFQSDDGSGGLTEYFKLDGANTRTTFSKNLKLEDSVYLLVGSGNDLQFLHNGTNSFILNETGDLTLRNNTDDGTSFFSPTTVVAGLQPT